jgi:7-carboxy-7-deazaguanine synthase
MVTGLRVDEIYKSVQGEGPRVGEPTIFIRFGGCNLRCPGWPCDTQHAIDPQFRKEWRFMKPDGIIDVLWHELYIARYDRINICLTGGEPFLQPNGELEELVDLLYAQVSIAEVEVFTNGTQPYRSWALDNLKFIMDWKLPGSGEDPYNATRRKNLANLQAKDAIKFVIKDFDDYKLAKELWYQHVRQTPVQVFYGIVWGSPWITNAGLARWVLDDSLPWKLNVQVHNHIWDRTQRGI